MSYLEADEAQKLLENPSTETLDLRGLDREDALCRLDRAVAPLANAAAQPLFVRIDSPEEAGGETLFQPVGRHLLDAVRRHLVERVLPVQQAEGGGGFVVERRSVHPDTGSG